MKMTTYDSSASPSAFGHDAGRRSAKNSLGGQAASDPEQDQQENAVDGDAADRRLVAVERIRRWVTSLEPAAVRKQDQQADECGPNGQPHAFSPRVVALCLHEGADDRDERLAVESRCHGAVATPARDRDRARDDDSRRADDRPANPERQPVARCDDSLPRPPAHDLGGHRDLRAALGAARDPAGARCSRRAARLLGDPGLDHRLRLATHARKLRRRADDRDHPAAAARGLGRGRRGRPARSRKSASCTRSFAPRTTPGS